MHQVGERGQRIEMVGYQLVVGERDSKTFLDERNDF